MKKIKKKANKRETTRSLPLGLAELLTVLGGVVLVIALIVCVRYCAAGDIDLSVTDGVLEDTAAPADDAPKTTVLTPIPAKEIAYPLPLTGGITLDQVYTATGYFPEDGSDEAVENVLAVKLTNISDQTLEYMTFSLTVNGEICSFSVATVPAEKSVYVFSTGRKTAPEQLTSLEKEVEFEIYFAGEPSAKTDTLSYTVQNGTIVVTNISDLDIESDIVVYYKATAEDGYLGGITYRLRISGGLSAGQSFSAYAPHAYAHMTEIMFTQYEE